MQVAQAIEPLVGERHGIEQPLYEYAVVVMMRNMFQLMLIFSFVEALILNLPAAFRHAEQGACADPLAG